MSDDLSKRSPADHMSINLREAWETNYWCKMLGVTEEQLRAAVVAVGSKVDKVRERLRK